MPLILEMAASAADPGVPLLEKEERAVAQASPTRVCNNPSPEQQAENAIRDNFPGWDSGDLYARLVDGVTLWQKILTDKTKNAQKKGTVTMGMLYYDVLRTKYRDQESVEKQLTATDPQARVNPKLFDAMLKSQRKPPQRGSMIFYLQTCERLAQGEMVGVCRWMLKLRPSLSAEQMNGGIAAMECFSRLEIRRLFKKEVELMVPHMSDILVQAP